MSVSNGPSIITSGLVLNLDAADKNSYPGSGTTWRDLSGNAYNGTLTNGPTFSSANQGAIVFDGVDDYINTSTSTALNLMPITLSGWAIITSGIGGTFINRYALGLNGYILNYTTSGINLYFFTNGTLTNYLLDYDTYSGTVTLNQWNFIAATVDSSGGKLYLNGSQVGTRSWSGTPSAPTTNTNLVLSYYPGVGNYLTGRIASTQIYNRALSASEIAQNYSATKTRFGL